MAPEGLATDNLKPDVILAIAVLIGSLQIDAGGAAASSILIFNCT